MRQQEARMVRMGIDPTGRCVSRPRVTRWMADEIELAAFEGQVVEIFDNRTREVNLTALAEAAAHHFDHNEWLDNPDHWVWDAAIDAVERCKRAGIKVRP
jgi:hypothetical protein